MEVAFIPSAQTRVRGLLSSSVMGFSPALARPSVLSRMVSRGCGPLTLISDATVRS